MKTCVWSTVAQNKTRTVEETGLAGHIRMETLKRLDKMD